MSGICVPGKGVAIPPHFLLICPKVFSLITLVWLCTGARKELGCHQKLLGSTDPPGHVWAVVLFLLNTVIAVKYTAWNLCLHFLTGNWLECLVCQEAEAPLCAHTKRSNWHQQLWWRVHLPKANPYSSWGGFCPNPEGADCLQGFWLCFQTSFRCVIPGLQKHEEIVTTLGEHTEDFAGPVEKPTGFVVQVVLMALQAELTCCGFSSLMCRKDPGCQLPLRNN